MPQAFEKQRTLVQDILDFARQHEDAILALTSGACFGFSITPFRTGFLALFALVPLFILLEHCSAYRRLLVYTYLAAATFHIIIVHWVMMTPDLHLVIIAGAFLLLNPILYFIPIGLWNWIRKRVGFGWSILAFPWIWISFEYLRNSTEISAPIFALGYSQTYSLDILQMASYTGIYGVSLWVILINMLLFLLYRNIRSKRWKVSSLPAIMTLLAAMLVFILPKIYGEGVLRSEMSVSNQSSRKAKIAIIQPNIDPYIKWQNTSESQLKILQGMTAAAALQHPDLIVWPETAIPRYIYYSPQDSAFLNEIRLQVNSLGVNLLTGALDLMYYDPSRPYPASSKVDQSGRHYDVYNSSILLLPHTDSVQEYNKIVLVPFAERFPYAEEICSLTNANFIRWDFGIVGLGIGKRMTIFSSPAGDSAPVKFATVICYETLFPQLVSRFVRDGAQFIVILSNESWWGKTAGSIQHTQIDLLRAIENHRWIVRCSNGGASCFIDPSGHILQLTDMDVAKVLTSDIRPSDEATFYSAHGDLFAQACVILALCSVLIAPLVRIRKSNNIS
ncbi:MAG TPA: apolipoprotein N-acyltransferase [Bacteroidota bacterium]|nr:apolipoprotein N-acyltransferase [Bacteroidota bacterium]